MWSERKAWKYLAKKWKKARIREVYYLAMIKQSFERGLCGSIHRLLACDLITREIAISIKEDIEEVPYHCPRGFIWSCKTKKGKRQRYKFCKEQAQRLKKG